MHKFATKIILQQNSVNQYLFFLAYSFDRNCALGVLFGVLCILVGILCVLFGVLGVLVCALAVLFGILGVLFGVQYIFLAYIIFIFFSVIGVCGIGMLYLLHLEFGMVHRISSSQKMCRIVLLVSE